MFAFRAFIGSRPLSMVRTRARAAAGCCQRTPSPKSTRSSDPSRRTAKIPGLSLAIAFRHQLLYSKGFGFADLEHADSSDGATPCSGRRRSRSRSRRPRLMQLVEQGKARPRRADSEVLSGLSRQAVAGHAPADPRPSRRHPALQAGRIERHDALLLDRRLARALQERPAAARARDEVSLFDVRATTSSAVPSRAPRV